MTTPLSRPQDQGSLVRRVAAWSVVGCLLAAAACSSPPLTSFDLTAPREGVRGIAAAPGQIVVAEPAAIGTLEEQRILARDAAGSVSFVGNAQWADRLPRLFQARLIQTFENVAHARSVGRPGDGTVADLQLNSELRAFQLDAVTQEAFVEVSVKLLDAKTGRIIAGRISTARVPVPDTSGPIVAQALDRALSIVLIDIVRWTSSRR